MCAVRSACCAPFDVTLDRSGLQIHVASNQSLLEALEEAGLQPPSMCRSGVCEMPVIDGQIEHRDHYLSDEQKDGMQSMMVCVSRAACRNIVLDF